MYVVVLSVLVGLLGGIAIGFQNPLASLMGQRLGIIESAFVIHLGGALVCCVPLLVVSGGRLDAWRTVPWYALGAGALGVAFISCIAFTIPRIGVAATVALIVTAQLTLGAWIDHFGLLGSAVKPFEAPRLLGIALLLVGVWLVVR